MVLPRTYYPAASIMILAAYVTGVLTMLVVWTCLAPSHYWIMDTQRFYGKQLRQGGVASHGSLAHLGPQSQAESSVEPFRKADQWVHRLRKLTKNHQDESGIGAQENYSDVRDIYRPSVNVTHRKQTHNTSDTEPLTTTTRPRQAQGKTHLIYYLDLNSSIRRNKGSNLGDASSYQHFITPSKRVTEGEKGDSMGFDSVSDKKPPDSFIQPDSKYTQEQSVFVRRIRTQYGGRTEYRDQKSDTSLRNPDRAQTRHNRDCQIRSTDMTKSCVNDFIISRSFPQKCSLDEITKNCSALRKAHRYEEIPVTKEELDFPLAFAIKMHRSPDQVEQLLRTIYRAHNFYCIHVDKKSGDAIFRTMSSLSACFRNVIVVEDRVSVVYSSAAVVESELRCMKVALESTVPWKYYLNLAGQEFPLRTNLEMVTILKLFNGANDIETYQMPFDLYWRIKNKFKADGDDLKMTDESKGTKGLNLRFYKGSAYGSFSRSFVKAVFRDQVAQSIIQWFNDTYAPEENVWQNINALPWMSGGYPVEVRHNANQHASRAVVWEFGNYTCKGDYQRSVCVFSKRDLPWLLKQPHLVANKFVAEDDPDVINCLEEIIFQRAKSREVDIDQPYFENLPHVAYYRQRHNQT